MRINNRTNDYLTLARKGKQQPREKDEVFAMTALTHETNVREPSEDDSEADDDFYEDIGFNKLVADAKDSNLSEEFDKLVAKVDQCRELQQTLKNFSNNLTHVQRQAEAASCRDAAQQQESDEKMEHIRMISEEAERIENSVPVQEEYIKQLERENGETKGRIAEGPGWTKDQQQERSVLADAIDHSRFEANEKNVCLDDLRSQLEAAKKEVEASIERRDQSVTNIDALKERIDDCYQCRENEKNQVTNAERTKRILIEELTTLTVDLVDLKAECDGEENSITNYESELENIKNSLICTTKEYEALAQIENATSDELNKIISENNEIEVVNCAKRKEMHTLFEERDR